jgi:hypothetical protein
LLGIVAHYLDKQTWKNQSRLLALKEVDGAHTGENMAEYVSRVVDDYEISDQLGFFTLDKITITCVTYLSFDAFKTGSCPSDEEFETQLLLNPLHDHAARNWGYHARAALTEVQQLILDFLDSAAKVSTSSQAMMVFRSKSGYSQRVAEQITGVHLAAYFGLRKVIIALLKNGHDPDVKDTDRRTPVWWAAQNGSVAVVRLLLARDGVDPDFKDKDGRTLLWWAARNGREEVVKMLLAKSGVDPDSKDKDGLDAAVVGRSERARGGGEAVARDGRRQPGLHEHCMVRWRWNAAVAGRRERAQSCGQATARHGPRRPRLQRQTRWDAVWMRDTDDYFERLLLFRDTSSDIAITLPAEASVEFLWLKAELSFI